MTARERNRLWWIAAGCAVAAAILWLVALRGVAHPDVLPALPWWAFLSACALSSILRAEIHTHRDSMSVNLAEIPLAIGLFMVRPALVLVGFTAASVVRQWTRRRPHVTEDIAHAAVAALGAGVAVGVFTVMTPDPADPFGPRSVIALTVAMLAAGAVSMPFTLFIARVRRPGAVVRLADVASAVQLRVMATATNTCLGIAGLLVAVYRPLLAFALVPPIALVLITQLAAGESRRRATRRRVLHRIGAILHSSHQFDDVAPDLLEMLNRVFGASRAEVVIVPERPGAVRRHTTLKAASNPPLHMSDLSFGEQEVLTGLLHRHVLHGDDRDETAMSTLLAERGEARGVAVSLRGGSRPQGLLLLFEDGRSHHELRTSDEELLVSVAAEIAAAIVRSRLAIAAGVVSDGATGPSLPARAGELAQVPDRSVFVESTGRALGRQRATRRPLAVMVIHLDGVGVSNDAVLAAVAELLRGMVRKVDLTARFGGEEFALLLNAMRNPDDVDAIAQRVVNALKQPFTVGDHAVNVSSSVGVAVVEGPEEAVAVDELLRRAELAVYLARRQGPDRYVVFDGGARQPLMAAATA